MFVKIFNLFFTYHALTIIIPLYSVFGVYWGDKWLTQNTGRYGYNYSEGNPLEVKKEKQRKQIRFKSVAKPFQVRSLE